MMEKITAFFKQHWPNAANAPLTVAAAVLAVALVVAFLSLWLAKITGVIYGFLRLVDSVLSPTVVFVGIIAGSFVWFVNKFSEEISDLINRLRKFAGAEFHPQRPVSESESAATGAPARAKADERVTEKIPASDSVAANKEESEVKSETADKAPADDFFAEIKGKAEAGESGAQYNLGVMYANGEGVEQDDAEAVKWYRCAVEQGNTNAYASLGWMYDNGLGVVQDYTEAVKWYHRAAEQGHAVAQNNLGVMYANGEGVDQDDAEAAKWYRLAAEQKYATAQNNLGVMCAKGRGVDQDDAEAVKWYRLAAEQGNADAQGNLGAAYHNGKGVAQNYREAYIWHSIAAGNGIQSSAKNRDDDAKLLSAEDLASAQAEAKRRMEEIRKRAESGK